MGIINNIKDEAKKMAEKKAKKEAKKAIKMIGIKALSAVVPILIPLLLIMLGSVLAISIIDYIVELFTAENNPKLVYESLEIEDVAELITIKGDETNGYYLDFTEGIDEKLEEIIEKYNKSPEYHNLPKDVNFLKKMLKAEVYTQFTDLVVSIPSNSKDGFQGAINIRRATPNKAPR